MVRERRDLVSCRIRDANLYALRKIYVQMDISPFITLHACIELRIL
ncbi:hypothetical protein HMPREF1155_1603 [Slackia sp. CM382]|nr:hypothetical protein HMPREF1155_1603 [Slackia sp. CM382]